MQATASSPHNRPNEFAASAPPVAAAAAAATAAAAPRATIMPFLSETSALTDTGTHVYHGSYVRRVPSPDYRYRYRRQHPQLLQ